MDHRPDRGPHYLAGTMLGGLMLAGVIAIVVLMSFSRGNLRPFFRFLARAENRLSSA